jgi:2-oxoisovalerate dehydrogenase E1 component
MDVFSATSEATKYSRTHSAPAVCHYEGLIRRFGHAATDRQSAYLDRDQITSFANVDVLESAIVQVVEVYNVLTYAEVRDRFEEIQAITRTGFDTAVLEDKVTRQGMMDRVSAAMIVVPLVANETPFTPVNKSGDKREVMRKLMNRIIMETLDEHNDVVYLGEDCRHGGYYVITEGVADKYSGQIFDFPPDETSLLGTAMGFSQLGLTPIVEIPYAKYLDCGADMFYEIALMHWLSAGKCKNGMIIRVQGFDRGLFGGNFHTHNTLQHIPPGVDVVCFSNGEDYVRGFRNAVLQAKAGRVVMLVDCTQLLNLRHLLGHDKKWERVYPSKHGDFPLMSFHQVRLHGSNPECKAKWGIVTYGNGVVTALQARGVLSGSKQFSQDDIDVIDCPYLSETPDGLKEISMGYSGLLFADICKTGPGSNVLANTIVSLQGEGKLPERWEHVAAPRTYNPLGSTSTFLNTEDIVSGIIRLADK